MINEEEKEECEIIDIQFEKKKKYMKRLANYTVHFGKYKKSKFQDMGDDREYTIWVTKQKEFLSKNLLLKEYLEYRLTQPVI